MAAPQPAITAAPAAGRVRYRVVAFAVGLAGITYLDRICISTLTPAIMRDLALTKLDMSYVFSAFAVAYALFEIPSAWWGERIGTRRVLTRIVCWWSAFTIATASVWSYGSMLAVRFLFGAGEAGAWPNAARTFSRWIPAPERGRVQGVFFAGAFLFGGLTPALVGLLEPHVGWRGVFACFGLTGFVWAAAWFRWFRDEPADHPQVGAGGARVDHRGPRAGRTARPGRPHAAGARRQRERVGAVPRLLLEQLRLVLRDDLAADLPGRAPRLHRRLPGPLFRPADAPQRRLGPARRHRHRPPGPASRAARRAGGGRPGRATWWRRR